MPLQMKVSLYRKASIYEGAFIYKGITSDKWKLDCCQISCTCMSSKKNDIIVRKIINLLMGWPFHYCLQTLSHRHINLKHQMTRNNLYQVTQSHIMQGKMCTNKISRGIAYPFLIQVIDWDNRNYLVLCKLTSLFQVWMHLLNCVLVV